MKIISILLLLLSLLAVACTADETKTVESNMPAPKPIIPEGAETITLAAGCFWCTEAVFQQIPGVISVTSGYIGGNVKDPSYEDVCTGATGHAEATQVIFDPKQTSLDKILKIFWNAHDPTTLNRQGADSGTQYRSGIFYYSDAQRGIAEKSKTEAQKEFSKPIVTEITKADTFYPAENYHQDYYRLNKNRNPYCHMVIAPKLKKLGLKE
jgi:peptide-methionine (S)-S-oxide reductase